MNYCTNCGNKVDSNAYVCTRCGVKLKDDVTFQTFNGVDKGGFGWGLLGFFVPIVGLILYLVWKDERPKTAKAAGKGALIYLIFYIVIFLLIFIFSFGVSWSDEKSNNYYDEEYYNFE